MSDPRQVSEQDSSPDIRRPHSSGVAPLSEPPSSSVESIPSSLDRDSTPTMAPGTIYAGRYEILSSLGGGASGHVYAARRLSDGLPCALKVLHSTHVGNRQVVQRFRREAAILAKLRGTHVVHVHDFGEDDEGRLFLALDQAPGQTLRQWMNQGITFSMDQVFDVITGVCEALREAHTEGIIHRDLKPENIVVDMEGEQVQSVHVLDFGLSKMLHHHVPGSTNLTEQNMVLGTPEYMAPEQVRGDRVDERCDIYSAGVVLYQMVYGHPPFTHRMPMAVMTAQLTEQPPWPSTRPDGSPVPPALLAVLQHALAKEPNERYPTAKMMLEALDKAKRAPQDLVSVRPPPPEHNDVAFSTTLSVSLAESRPSDEEWRRSTEPPQRKDDVPAGASTEARQGSLSWVAILVLVGLAGLLAGVLLALQL